MDLRLVHPVKRQGAYTVYVLYAQKMVYTTIPNRNCIISGGTRHDGHAAETHAGRAGLSQELGGAAAGLGAHGIDQGGTATSAVRRAGARVRRPAEQPGEGNFHITVYRVVQLSFTPEIEVFYMMFDRSLSIFSMTPLKQHMKYVNFRC